MPTAIATQISVAPSKEDIREDAPHIPSILVCEQLTARPVYPIADVDPDNTARAQALLELELLSIAKA
jgi:hypothetical protein